VAAVAVKARRGNGLHIGFHGAVGQNVGAYGSTLGGINTVRGGV